MNTKIIKGILSVACLTAVLAATAQEEEARKQKREHIIIRKDKDSTKKMVIEVDGDKVTINGKPVDQFSGDNIDIITDHFIYRAPHAPGIPGVPRAPRAPRIMHLDRDHLYGAQGNRAVLGVTTDKVKEGAKITDVTKDGAAEKAGLKEGDIITRIDDKEVSEENTLYSLIGKYKPEDKVKVNYIRDGKKKTTEAVLGKPKATTFAFNGSDFDFDFDMPSMNMVRRPKLGMQIQDTEDGNGVKITEVSSDMLASKAGLKVDDVIIEANGKAVKGIEDVRGELKEMKEGDVIKIKYKRGGTVQETDVKFPKVLKKANL